MFSHVVYYLVQTQADQTYKRHLICNMSAHTLSFDSAIKGLWSTEAKQSKSKSREFPWVKRLNLDCKVAIISAFMRKRP